MHDPIDEWVVSHLLEFDSKKVKSISQANLTDEAKLSSTSGEGGSLNESNKKELLAKIKNALGDSVADVVESQRLKDSLACLVSTEEQMSPNLERVLKAAGQEVPVSKRILEINLSHPLVEIMSVAEEGSDIKSWSDLLYEQSLLSEGARLDDPSGFVKRMNGMLAKASHLTK